MNRLLLTILFLSLSSILYSQDQNALLWKIESKNSEQTSYLFGTIHSRDKRIFKLDSAIIPLIKKVDLFVSEARIYSDITEEMLYQLILPGDKTLKSIYTEEEYELIAREFEKRSSRKIDEFELIHPFVLLMYVKRTSPYVLPLSLDEYLYQVALEEQKEIYGLESVEEQISFLIKSQDTKYVYNYFKNNEYFEGFTDRLRNAYLAEDSDAIMKLVKEESSEGFDMGLLLDDRNKIMVNRIDSISKKHSAFYAIGAAHLFGQMGVVSRLRKLGYKVTPIHGKKKMHQLIEYDINWKEYKSFNDNFSVKFPEEPEVQTKENGSNVYTSDLVHEGNMSVTFTIQEQFNPSFKAMDTKEMSKIFLHQVQSILAKGMELTALQSKYTTLNGRNAAETLFSKDDGEKLLYSRFILAEDKLYILMVYVRPNTEDLRSIEEFMDSFNILH